VPHRPPRQNAPNLSPGNGRRTGSHTSPVPAQPPPETTPHFPGGGYASTAAKHGHQTFTAIRDALAGNPWIPPIPGTA
jgi:hypothetical protein